MSGVEVAKEELKEIDICSEEESGVFVNSGASYLDGFSAFHKWVANGRSVSDGYCECAKTASVSLSKCAKVPHGAPAGEIRMERAGGGGGGIHEAGVYSDEEDLRASRASSIVDCLLVELYDTYSNGVRGVDSSTEASSSEAFLGRSNTGSNFLQELQEKHTRRHQMKYLAQKGPEELKWIIQEVKYRIGVQSAKLVRQVKRKDRLRQKFQKNCDIVTACLQAVSQKRNEAGKVMIYLIDKVLPDSYFANNLRALSVDMAVFRDLLRLKLPELSQQLHHLQKVANREGGGSYEPPLTNVFTMQWFLTMFATCLPHHTVLKIWDSVFFEGSEMLLRVALAIWAKLGERIEECQTADEFYSTMGCLTQEMLEHNLIDSNELMQTVYSMAPFPFPQLAELREKYTYNITPFPTPVRANSSLALHGWESDDDADMDDEDSIVTALGCLGPLGGLLAPEIQRYQKHLKDQRGEQSSHGSNMAELSPGAVGAGRAEHQAAINSMMLERMSTDISALKKQYSRIKQKQQQQTGLLYIHTGPRVEAETIEPHQASKQQKHHTDKCPATSILPSQIGPSPVVNHLLLGRRPRPGQRSSKNGVIHNDGSPQAHSTPSQNQMIRTRHHSPWRTHVRAHRRNIARARAQLGFDDSLEIEDELTDVSKTEEASEEGRREDEEQERVETISSDVSQQDHISGEADDLQEIDKQLSSLELEPELSPEAASDPTPPTPQPEATSDPPTSTPPPESDSNPNTPTPPPESDSNPNTPTPPPESDSNPNTPTPPPESDSNPNTPTPPPEPQPEPKPTASAPLPSTRRPGSDSSSSESGGSLKRNPSTLAGEPSKPQQIFSPFPCIKTPRKSITARNLGLYGPNARTPNVHFPQMSRSMNHVGSTTKRR
ncbi:TBC1 domain family member 30-like [Sinocyclocheilus rhinocerous]|uniref:TBC1 domain family member 30-like n=1 Tax=Sinocyclocheilus rhinocerous TaxID=307959 RepID=UPI0007B9A7C5|nr:PREDICTED: TBC1 domain family member 30-like [Sinocyclocheilus rhinocerous]